MEKSLEFQNLKQCDTLTKYKSIFTDDGHDRPKPREGRPPLPLPDEYKCLIRAKASSKKLSTVVSQDDVPKVMEEYSKILKNGMDNLKKVKRNRNKQKL